MALPTSLRQILALFRRIAGRRERVALSVRAAAAEMGLRVPQLRRLIRAGVVLTCLDGSVPVSEIRLWLVSQRGRRRLGART